jgi:hypothetical protein
MGTMVHTALEHSTAALGLPPMLGEVIQPARPAQVSVPLPAPPRERTSESSFETTQTAAPQEEPSPPPDARTVSPTARAGIAFHGKTLGTGGSSSSNASPAKINPAKPAPSSGSGGGAAGPPPVEEDDILEGATPPPMPVRVAPTEGRAVPARRSFESLVADGDRKPILSDVGAAPAGPASTLGMSPQIQLPQAAASDMSEGDEPSVGFAVPRTAVANLKKCQQCGFPVSEGRQLCLDCEKKLGREGGAAITATAANSVVFEADAPSEVQSDEVPTPAPSFMSGADDQASWLSTHKFMVIALALAAIGIVGVVLLR